MITEDKLHKLIKYEEFDFRPIHGEFDIEMIQTQIMKLPGAWNDPKIKENFLIFGDDESKNNFVSQYNPTEKYSYPYVLIISLTSTSIYFNVFAGHDYIDYALVLMKWIIKNYQCEVTDTFSKISDL